MARVNKMSVLKRQRERKKAEKAAMKREQKGGRRERGPADPDEQVASREDLEGYGLLPSDDAEDGDTA